MGVNNLSSRRSAINKIYISCIQVQPFHSEPLKNVMNTKSSKINVAHAQVKFQMNGMFHCQGKNVKKKQTVVICV